MKTPTIYDIKYQVQRTSHYFERDTMRFFGQTLKDFHVKKSPQGNIFIYAPGWNEHCWSFALVHGDKMKGITVNSYQEILDYIAAH